MIEKTFMDSHITVPESNFFFSTLQVLNLSKGKLQLSKEVSVKSQISFSFLVT